MTIYKVMIEFKMGGGNFWQVYDTSKYLDGAQSLADRLKVDHLDQEIVVQKIEETTVYRV